MKQFNLHKLPSVLSAHVCTFLDDKDALVAASSLNLECILEYLKTKNSDAFWGYDAMGFFRIAYQFGSLAIVKFFWENEIIEPTKIIRSRFLTSLLPHSNMLSFLKAKWPEVASCGNETISFQEEVKKWFILAARQKDIVMMKTIWSLETMKEIPWGDYYEGGTKESVDFLWSILQKPDKSHVPFVALQVGICLERQNFMLAEHWLSKEKIGFSQLPAAHCGYFFLQQDNVAIFRFYFKHNPEEIRNFLKANLISAVLDGHIGVLEFFCTEVANGPLEPLDIMLVKRAHWDLPLLRLLLKHKLLTLDKMKEHPDFIEDLYHRAALFESSDFVAFLYNMGLHLHSDALPKFFHFDPQNMNFMHFFVSKQLITLEELREKHKHTRAIQELTRRLSFEQKNKKRKLE